MAKGMKKLAVDKKTVLSVAAGIVIAGIAMQILKPVTDKGVDKVHEIMYKAGV